MANVSVQDLLEKAANLGDADSARSLMNLVMQFRKVCNHPELFERADVVAPFSFSDFGRSGPLNREGDFVQLPPVTPHGWSQVPYAFEARTWDWCVGKAINLTKVFRQEDEGTLFKVRSCALS